MMRTALDKKEKTRNVRLSFALQGVGRKGVLVAKKGVNCDCRGGKLRKAPAGTPCLKSDRSPRVCTISNVAKICLIKEYSNADGTYVERFSVLDQNGRFYVQRQDTQSFTLLLGGLPGADVVRTVDRNNWVKTVFINGETCLILEANYTGKAVKLANNCKTGAFFKHRLFVGVKPSALACSAPGDELSFTESVYDGGLLRFPCVGGEIVAIKPFEDKLYVFFEYGILKLTVGGAIKDFEAQEIEYVGGKIYGRTVRATNKALFFMAEDGLYRLDGRSVKRLFSDFVQLPKEETLLESGVGYGDKVLIRYLTDEGYKTLAVYEDGEDCFYMDGLNALSCEEGGRCLFIDENKRICQLSEDGVFGSVGRFIGAETDFGLSGRKTLTKLSFEGKGNVSVTIENGGRTFVRSLIFEDGKAEVKLSERGDKFVFHFTLSSGSEISSAVAEVKRLAV